MANKREFKKSVEALCAALVDEMSMSYYMAADKDRDLISEAITKVLNAMEVARKDSNVLFKKGVRDFDNIAAYNEAKKKFYKENYDNAIAKFNDSIGEALKDYNKAIPETEKEANKASVK